MAGQFSLRMFVLLVALTSSAAAARADDASWQIGKSSGDVWVVSQGAQPAALGDQAEIKAGDVIRTGRTGRVLLKRGEETILVAPNTEVGIPKKPQDGLSTTILQKAGSILLSVEKRNENHFEVETPYLAAVVKGTQFRVDVDRSGARVNVVRGQVEVADFRSGQIAQVMPGQLARVSLGAVGGISLSGPGSHLPIVNGRPRPPSIERLLVPRGGLHAPASTGRQIRALHAPGAAAMRSARAGHPAHQAIERHSRTRISAPLGEVKLDVGRATNHLVRGHGGYGSAGRAADFRNSGDNTSNSPTASAAASAATAAASVSNGLGGGSAHTNGSISSSGSNSSNVSAGTVGLSNSSNGNGTGNDGSSNRTNSGDDDGNGNRYGNRHGNRHGNGNGNGGVGNGNGIGNARH
jgi:hypothetical protein